MDVVLAYDSIDVYQNPKSKKEEIHAVYNGYTKFISREFDTKEEAMHDREVCSTHCCICGKTARKTLTLVFGRRENYYCVAWCPEHGYLKGKARMKHSDEGKLFVVKTIRISSEQEAGEIRQKKETCGRRGIRRGKKCKKGRGNGNGIKGFISSAFLIGKQSGIGYNKK